MRLMNRLARVARRMRLTLDELSLSLRAVAHALLPKSLKRVPAKAVVRRKQTRR